MKLAVISGFLGKLQDRFCGYHEAKEIGNKLDLLGQVKGVTGVELIYPYDFVDLKSLQEGLSRNNLQVAAVNLNLKNDAKWVRGSLTATEASIREEALRWIKEAMDAAAVVGSPRVTVALLNDGHDYNFEIDYQQAWQWVVEGISAGAKARPDRVLSVEYKLNEPRVRTTIGDVAKGILLCQEVAEKNVGLTLDIGHSLYALENPSESLALMKHFKIQPYIHLNDNCRNWDWDLLPGTVNLWDMIEFLYYVKEFGYDDWMTFDVFPSRIDVVRGFNLAVMQTKKLQALTDKLDRDTVRKHIQAGDPVGAWENLFNLL